MYTNWTMQKSELNDEEYSQVAEWCNENQTHTHYPGLESNIPSSAVYLF